MVDLNRLYSQSPVVLKDYLTYLSVIKGKSDNTIYSYYFDLKMFIRFLMTEKQNYSLGDFENIDILEFNQEILNSVTLTDLYSFMAYVTNNHSSNDKYRARKVSSLKSFFKYLSTKANIIDDNPALNLETPKLKKRLPKYLSVDESIRFLQSIDGDSKIRDLAMFSLFLNCGIRLSELVGINIRDINFTKCTLRIIGKGDKERIVYLNDLCLNAIKAYMEVRPNDGVVYEDRDALFLSNKKRRISNRMVQILAKKYFKAADIDERVFTPHKLRHTAATIMYNEGNVDIRTLQELLGHVSLATTQIYTHISNDELKKATQSNPLANLDIDLTNDNKDDKDKENPEK